MRNKNIKVFVSLLVAFVFLMSTVMAAPAGLYIGGTVSKYYTISQFMTSTTKLTEMNTAGLANVKYVDNNGKIAAANTLASGTPLNTALKDIVAGDLANSYTKVDGSTMNPNPETTLAVESVSAITTTKFTVVLNKQVDAVAAANFAIPGLTVTSATLGADKKTVTLVTSVTVPQTAYTLTVSGLKSGGATQANATKAFTTPTANQLYSGTTLTYTDTDGILKADGASSTLVTFSLKDAEGKLVTSAEDVVVAFTSTFGNFGEKRVTVQNGIATSMFTSESLTSTRVADLTGTIVEAKDTNLIGIKASKTIELNPNPDQGGGDTTGARVTEAEAAQADRIILYFNKEVSVEKYTKANATAKTRVLDATKAAITVTKSVNNELVGTDTVVVKGFLPVQGNNKALQVLLDVDSLFVVPLGSTATKNMLDDNAKIKVDFTDKTGTVAVPSTVNFNLTDARKPEMVRVDREGLKTIKVTFSEPVTDNIAGISASTLANWSIDGKLLSDTRWGVVATPATATVGTFDPYTMEDTRNVVTITLGKKADGSQIYFTSGTHSVQGANIGDWAAETDTLNNKMNTQTLDFDIPADTEAPVATVEVQSPEQWLVTYNKDVDETAATFASKMRLQKYNTTTKAWANDGDVVSYGLAEVPDDNLNIVVTKYDTNKFLVETDKDWSNVHNTATSNKDYYNFDYRLFIPAGTVTNPANGIKNAEQGLDLNGAMDVPDTTSPVISTIVETPLADPGTSYQVTMSEPVKLNGGANTEGSTASQTQLYSAITPAAWTKIPTPKARFIKADNSVTILGTVDVAFVAPTAPGTQYERILTVTPNKALTAGEWVLSVESISDDVGNTAATATQRFTVTIAGPVDTDFAVAWAYADKNTADGYVKTNIADASNDAVYVKFTKPVKITGDFVSALETQNYTLNGKALPDGTQIVADITGYDDHDSVYDSVTIILPDGTITDTETTVLNVTSFIESTDSKKLSNPGEKKLTFQYNTVAGASVDSADEFKAALADAKVRVITLGGNIVLAEDLTVSRLVDINLGAFNITAGANSFKVDTTETGRMIISGTGTIDKLEVTAPGADFVNNATITNLTVKDLYTASLFNNGTITTLTVQDSISLTNAIGATIGTLNVAADKAVAVNNAGTITTINNLGTVTGATSTGVAGTFAVTQQGVTAVTEVVPTALAAMDGGLVIGFGAGVGDTLNGSTFILGAIADGTATTATYDAATKRFTINGDFNNTATVGMAATADIQTALRAAVGAPAGASTITVAGPVVEFTGTPVATAAVSGGVTAVTNVDEVATITITSPATAAGDIYVTVNGVATKVAVAAGDAATVVATKIATALIVTGYTDAAVGNTVTLTQAGAQTDLTGAIQ